MKKKTAEIVIVGMSLILLLAGCAQNGQKVQAKIDKQNVYIPMKISEEVPEIKHEPIIDIDKKDMEQYERDQKHMSDFDKYMQERDRRLRNK